MSSLELNCAEWQRQSQPVLSGMLTEQPWCKVSLYSPAVVFAQGKYRMWYIGISTTTRTNGYELGYAESDDGLVWSEHQENPILTPSRLPEGKSWQTPHVIFDSQTGTYRMWFVMAEMERDSEGGLKSFFQRLGYATSKDALTWEIHPTSLYPSGRGPCVVIDNADSDFPYHLWMNSSHTIDGKFDDLVSSIFHFKSVDGLHWERDAEPAVKTAGPLKSVVYPFVLKQPDGWIMWYGCHVDGGCFEIYCSTSEDGVNWTHHVEQPAFPATRDPNTFDGRYTSTPCVLEEEDRYLLYYSSRDCGHLYRSGDGKIRYDAGGIYRHIGVAVLPRS